MKIQHRSAMVLCRTASRESSARRETCGAKSTKRER